MSGDLHSHSIRDGPLLSGAEATSKVSIRNPSETANSRFAVYIASMKKAWEKAMKDLNQVIEELPPGDRAKVMRRAKELIGEEMALQHLRKARRLTQQRMAKLLHIGQDSVSRIESRSDLLISTLRSYVEAMGGSLKLVVQFRDGVATLSGLGADDSEEPSKRSASDRARARPKRKQLKLAHGRR